MSSSRAGRVSQPAGCGSTDGACAGRASSATAAAIARLIRPAVRSVPGSPAQAMRMKPLASTPAAAPRLLAKYSIATASPGARRASFIVARTSPALISGKVAPSSTDCGRISRQERASLAPSTSHSLPSPGSSVA